MVRLAAMTGFLALLLTAVALRPLLAMHHAALPLGYDIALGHGREGIFRHLPKVAVGTEPGETVRYGNPEEREGAVEPLITELCLFN